MTPTMNQVQTPSLTVRPIPSITAFQFDKVASAGAGLTTSVQFTTPNDYHVLFLGQNLLVTNPNTTMQLQLVNISNGFNFYISNTSVLNIFQQPSDYAGVTRYSMKNPFYYPLLFLPRTIIEAQFYEPDANATGEYDLMWYGVRINDPDMPSIQRKSKEIKDYCKTVLTV